MKEENSLVGLSVKTRKELNDPIFGAPKTLSDSVLPTYEDVFKYYLFTLLGSTISDVPPGEITPTSSNTADAKAAAALLDTPKRSHVFEKLFRLALACQVVGFIVVQVNSGSV